MFRLWMLKLASTAACTGCVSSQTMFVSLEDTTIVITI